MWGHRAQSLYLPKSEKRSCTSKMKLCEKHKALTSYALREAHSTSTKTSIPIAESRSLVELMNARITNTCMMDQLAPERRSSTAQTMKKRTKLHLQLQPTKKPLLNVV